MHIRKLELQGFKSFPDRTNFHFGPGVSGVVGPNGCGKSNVVDAVKWCLGEQSAKSLRGRSMEDIIFAGSESRKATGLAEVTLTFEAAGEPFAGEFARCEEIQITRRLFRDGHSEYLVNQQRCRLKDIQDIFRDTGASNRMYSFIEQGRIGEIVKAKPEQRRSLIEEAAGISRYKAKKRETELRLDGTNRNLERATDLVEDLSSRLRTLRRQVAKATRYRRLRTEVRQGEIYLGLTRYSGLAGDRRVLGERLRTATQTEETKRRELERQDVDIHAQREAVEVLEAGVGVLRDELAEMEASRREQESARMYQGRESQQLQERINRLRATHDQANQDLAIGLARREEAQAEHDKVASSATSIRTQASQAEAVANDAEAVVLERRRAIDDFKATVLDLVRQLARDRANRDASKLRREDVDNRIADLCFRVQVISDEIGDHTESLAAVLTADDTARKNLEESLSLNDVAAESLEACRTREVETRQARRNAENVRVEAERAAAQGRARLESLESLQAAHDGVEEHARKALEVEGVLGTLADHLDVPEALDTLVATALGDELEYVLVPNAETAVKVAEATQGRVSMLLVGEPAKSTGPFAGMGGDPVGEAALGHLMGSCVEVADLGAAISRHQQDGGAFLVPEGPGGLPVLVTPRGEVRIGPAKTGATMVLQRRRELAELNEHVPVLEETVRETQEQVERSTAEQEAAVTALEAGQMAYNAAKQRLGEAQLAQRSATSERERLERGQSGRTQQLTALQKEQAALQDLLAQLSAQHVDLGGAIEAAQASQIAQEEQLHIQQQALVDDEVVAKDLRQKAVVCATEQAGVEQRLKSLARMVEVAKQTEEGAARQVAVTDQDMNSAQSRIGSLAEDDQRLVGALQKLSEGQASLREKIEAGRTAVLEARTLLRSAEESVRGLRDEREAASTLRMELERQIDQVKTEIAQIRSQLEERYQVSVTGLLDRLERNGQIMVEVPEEARQTVTDSEDPDESASHMVTDELEDLCIKPSMLENETLISEWVERLTEAKRRLERVGEVNLVAVAEYAEVKTRYDTLESQRHDLEESVRSIRNTIAQLNRTCRERFRETFDRVNALFQEGYPKLMGGGRARLVLTDEEDMLETGVDIEVQPPGKRLQNMALLSGGEMAMTAIALIFSLFQVKPSPFCLLDEVDAPLDEANGARFNNLLREMAKLSQFIVITHNKKTMECVDTLYGVTMPDPGCSQLVSVKLD
jgi:chromosome segregation protein